MSLPFPPLRFAATCHAPAHPAPDHPGAAAGDPYLATLVPRMTGPVAPPLPDDARQIVPDGVLRRLAQGDPAFDRGEVPADMQAEIAMLLPDIAMELLARRAHADLAATARRQACKR